MYKINLQYHNACDLTENGQTTDSKYALLVKDGDHWTNHTMLFKCRDYFNDTMHVLLSKERELHRIYGFKFNFNEEIYQAIHGEAPIPMLFNYGNHSASYDSYSNFTALHKIEEELGFIPTNIVEADVGEYSNVSYYHDKFVVLEVDPRWLSSTVMLSAYSQLVRLLAYKGDTLEEICKGVEGGTDNNFARELEKPEFMLLLRNWEKVFGRNELPYATEEIADLHDTSLQSMVHNGSGILSMMQGIHMKEPEPALGTFIKRFQGLDCYTPPEPEPKPDCGDEEIALSA